MKLKKFKVAATLIFVLSMLALFSMSVSAAIDATIDFENEIIELTGGSGNGTVKYMYCPNVDPRINMDKLSAADKKKLASEKWYPVYGNSIDISKYIPRADKETFFAFRDADEFADADGVYASRVTSKLIPSRPKNISQAYLKTNIEYQPLTEVIEIRGLLRDGYDYKVGISSWITNQTDATIDASSKYNALGGTVTIRKSATDSAFASIEYKIKIPKAPATPKVRINEKTGKIIGISKRDQKWSTSVDGEYNEFPDKTIDIDEIESQLRGIEASGDDDYIVYIKVPATDKKPSSQAQRLEVKRTKKK